MQAIRRRPQTQVVRRQQLPFVPVRRHGLHAEHGQVAAEYVLIVAVVAVGCLVAVLLLGGTVSNLFDSSTKPVAPAPLLPPVSNLAWPSTLEECEDSGWRDYAQFADEEACRDYVESLTP